MVMTWSNCDGDGTSGSGTGGFPASPYLAHYGVGFIWDCSDGATPDEPICNPAGSGWLWNLVGGDWAPTWRPQSLAAVTEPSRIAYIGTTKNGVWRVASSAAWKAGDLFNRKGLHTLEFYIIATPRRGRHATYRKLERALLLRFRERYGSTPAANKQGQRLRWREDDGIFTSATINKILDDFA